MPAYRRALREKALNNLNKFGSVEELQKGINKYIHYNNHDRIQPKLKGLSPVLYRTQPLPA
jgi:putative transposase